MGHSAQHSEFKVYVGESAEFQVYSSGRKDDGDFPENVQLSCHKAYV